MEDRATTLPERGVLRHLVGAWNAYNRLDGTRPDEIAEFRQAIHRAQDLLAVRVARRADPETWGP